MSNQRVSWAVNRVVNNAVVWAGKGAVTRSMDWAVSDAVWRAVVGAVEGDESVADAVYGSKQLDPKHPALQEFLREAL